MGVTGFTEVLTSTIPAPKLFKASVIDGYKLSPKLMPQAIASASIVEGDGGAGSIKLINFTPAMPFPFLKERIDIMDKEKMECKMTLIEGAHIGTKLEWGTIHIKVESTDDGGSVYKATCEFKSLGDTDYTAEEIQVARSRIIGMFKAVEAYVLANPDA
ncbi:hypothetical protein IFM89_021455 [Coptis chinensis]|uniref:Bet v I/Major latex protein domain-containing protein n=1 Tax=Coptis chinensis TaxID=261450 RepID=A0A835LS16_9MAGN|nr:hypothetical protein IFM89_021455 [Coptis chinensis]